MIERHWIREHVRRAARQSSDDDTITDDIMALITEQDEQYRELVEAAVIYAADEVDSGGEWEALVKAVQPFLPPKPSLSEKLEALRPTICQDDSIVDNKLKEYIAEAKQLENDLVLAIGYR